MFLVKSSVFADVINKYFKSGLQTFVRQLHYYQFSKQENGSVWSFQHQAFLRGRKDLLERIVRKPVQRKKREGEEEEDAAAVGMPVMVPPGANPLEVRLAVLEMKVAKMQQLEMKVNQLEKALVEVRDLNAAQSILSLMPEKKEAFATNKAETASKKRKVDPSVDSIPVDSGVGSGVASSYANVMANMPPAPVAKLSRLSSAEVFAKHFEFKDFPFEDNSSVGSINTENLMRELQMGVFADFDGLIDDFTQADPSTTTMTLPTVDEVVVEDQCKGNGECFKIPQNFKLMLGVTVPLLRQTFELMAKLCCPNKEKVGDLQVPEGLVQMCHDMPHPSTLPPVEQCPVLVVLLPILRAHITEEIPDIVLMRAARQVYEVYHTTMLKKIGAALPSALPRVPRVVSM